MRDGPAQYTKMILLLQNFRKTEEYGIDWDEVVPLADPETVQVPLTKSTLSAEQYTLLHQSFDPIDMSSDCDGAGIYCAMHMF